MEDKCIQNPHEDFKLKKEKKYLANLNWLVNRLATDEIPRYHNKTGWIKEK